jgi:hypothetical protein
MSLNTETWGALTQLDSLPLLAPKHSPDSSPPTFRVTALPPFSGSKEETNMTSGLLFYTGDADLFLCSSETLVRFSITLHGILENKRQHKTSASTVSSYVTCRHTWNNWVATPPGGVFTPSPPFRDSFPLCRQEVSIFISCDYIPWAVAATATLLRHMRSVWLCGA